MKRCFIVIFIQFMFSSFAVAFECGKTEFLGNFDNKDIAAVMDCMRSGELNDLRKGFRLLDNGLLSTEQAGVVEAKLSESGSKFDGVPYGLLADHFLGQGALDKSLKYATLGRQHNDKLSEFIMAKLLLFGYQVDQDIPKAMGMLKQLKAEGYFKAEYLLHKITELQSGKEVADIEYPDVPSKVVHPQYPRKAANRSISGYSIIKISTDENGKVTEAEVIESYPRKYFVKSSERAAWKLEYPPKYENGKKVPRKNILYKFHYQIK